MLEGPAYDVQRGLDELGRQLRIVPLRPTSIPLLFGPPEIEDIGNGRSRVWAGGQPYRPWTVSDLEGQWVHLGIRTSIAVADTGSSTMLGFAFDAGGAVADTVFQPFADAGQAVLSVTDAVGTVASSVGQSAPALGTAASGLVSGAANAAAAVGQGVANLGGAARWAPTTFTLVLLGLALAAGGLILLGKAGPALKTIKGLVA